MSSHLDEIKNEILDELKSLKLLNTTEKNVRFVQRALESTCVLRLAASRGFRHWIVTFSGGKDSTTTLILALETVIHSPDLVERIDVVYSDTKIEIPVIRYYAMKFLEFLQKFHRVAKLPVHYHVVYPPIQERFWVCLLGKGYPPPHQRFRWCTRRLKISPAENLLRTFIKPHKSIILTGVRFGESRDRDVRLSYTCARGGECGQGMWFQYSSRMNAGYLAPIIHWRECDVWDFLNFYAPSIGYPTNQLETEIYNGRETRFGCWMCTVVRQDKTMKKITSLPQWAYLRPLLEFRQRVKDVSASLDSRIIRPDGRPGKLRLSVREKLLDELLELQKKVNLELISDDEIRFIKDLWVIEHKKEEKCG